MRDLLQSIASRVSNKASPGEMRADICELLTYLKSHLRIDLSVWHPLGFVLFKLGSVEGIGSLRMHIWPDNQRKPQQPHWAIHNHIWTLKSHIICGTATNEIYSVKCVEGPALHQFYQVRYEDNRSILESTGRRISCVLASTANYTKGEYYEVSGSCYHATRVRPDILTATIVLTTDGKPIAPTVIGGWQANSTYTYERQNCSPLEVLTLLDKLLVEMKVSRG
jgi:hypothetical protein